MKHIIGAVFLLLSLNASAFPFSDIFAFGDSLTDSGNVASVPGTVARPVPFLGAAPSYYSSGRFSNGPVWVENVAVALGVRAAPVLQGGTNYAFGGAVTGPLATPPRSAFPPVLGNPAYPPSMLDQAHELIVRSGGTVPAGALYAVYGGFNDVFNVLGLAAAGGDPSSVVSNAVNNIGAVIEELASAGAVNFLVLNLFDLSLTPQIAFVGMPSSPAIASAVTRAFNSALDMRLDDIASSSAIHLIEFNTFDFFNSVVANPGAYGFTNAALPCARNTSVCSNPDSFVFWDGIHQTAAFNRVLASAIIQAVPEPGTSEILIFGLTALAFNYRRNNKHRATGRLATRQSSMSRDTA